MKYLILMLFISSQALAGYILKRRIYMPSRKIQNLDAYSVNMGSKIKILKRVKEFINEKDPSPNSWYEEIYYPGIIPTNFSKSPGSGSSPFDFFEVQELVKQGADKNRIVLSIIGDGYTMAEKEKFFADSNRIVNDLFKEVTFKSYLPLFNIYAIFVPSKDSGITDLKRKDTVFGLYRAPKGSKRGVMPGNRRNIEKALKLTGAHVDYPVIIANDDFYGGLGGRYAITTRSIDSGSMVLRHELGHNFSNVGEEYDGGQVYDGANFSRSPQVSWAHWLTSAIGPFNHIPLHGNYVWENLSPGQSTSLKFSNQEELAYEAVISAVSWHKPQDMHIELDGKTLSFGGKLSIDRSFFKSKLMKLPAGSHNLKITNQSDHIITLAFARGNGYPAHYNFAPNEVNAFSVYNYSGRHMGYRPTHGMCLMRDMRSKHFCPVDQENIWLRFLDRLNLIDDMQFEPGRVVRIKTLPVGMTSIRWLKKQEDGSWFEFDQMYNRKVVVLSPGEYQIRAYFNHPELRKNDDRRREVVSFKID